MLYYRTKTDIKKLAGEIPNFTHRSQIHTFIPRKHTGVVEIGMLSSVMKDAVWFARGERTNKTHQLRVSDAVMDFIVNDGPFDDAVNHRQIVIVYGRSEKGRLVDVIALNLENLVDPDELRGRAT